MCHDFFLYVYLNTYKEKQQREKEQTCKTQGIIIYAVYETAEKEQF